MPTKRLPDHSSVRWDEDLKPVVTKWFKKNPGWSISQLANMSIREFMKRGAIIEPVDGFDAKTREELIKSTIAEHADTIARLK